MSGGHTIERKARAGGAGGAMHGWAGEAHQPEALAGRGEAALAAGSGWAGHDKAIQTCAGRSVGVQQALMAACGLTGKKRAVHIGTELLLHGTSHMVSGLRAMPAQRPYVP
jgi:hypothetical protein